MKVLRILLWFLPVEFRREYGDELLQTVHDQWRETIRCLGPLGQMRFWFRQWLATVGVGFRLRWGRGILGRADRRVRRRESGMDGVWKDVLHAARSLRARPAFTLVAVLTLGLGVGASTAMFSAVNSVLLRALPYQDAGDVVVLKQTHASNGSFEQGVSASNLRDVATSARSLSQASVAEAHGLRLVENGRAVSLRSWLVSEGFFEAIGGKVHLGRTLLPEEFTQGRERVVLLSHRTWRTRFGGDSEIIGRDLVLDGAAHTVVGVLSPEFKYPSAAELWGPRPDQPWDDDLRARATMESVARLSPGTTVAEAQAELDQIAAELAQVHPDANDNMGFAVIPLRKHLFGNVKPPLMLLLGAVGLVLWIAAANVAGLQLARGSGRSREYALRSALGASSRRILRLVVVESFLLAGAGGLLGIALAYFGLDVIRILGPNHLPRIDELRIDGAVLSFALVAAIGSALVAGIAPTIRALRVNLQVSLAEGSRGTTLSHSTGLRDRLVVVEIALALVLTIGAGLLVQSFERLLNNDLGFDPEGRLAVQVWAYDDNHQAQLSFFERSVEEIGALPGVQAVGLTTDLPLADGQSILSRSKTVPFSIDNRAIPIEGNEPAAGMAAIDGAYAEAMGIVLNAGRNFSIQDHSRSPPVVMVNEAFVRRHFPDRDPIGEHIILRWRAERPREIVGVLADVRRQGFESEPEPEIYVALSQEPSNGLTFVVKTATDPASLTAAVQQAMWTADPSQATWATRPMTHLMGDWTRQRRFNTALLVAFAGLALFLAAIGVYGLMSFSVEQRVNELGIRRALGGDTRNILWMVLRRGLTLTLAGVGLGLVGSVALTRLMRGMLFDIGPFDPFTFVSLSVFVVGVSLVAAFLPARRATRVDPMVALRME